MSNLTRFPLCWPDGWKRIPPAARKNASFGYRAERITETFNPLRNITVAVAVARLKSEMRLFKVGAEDWLISTNVQINLEGHPRSDRGEPQDPGAAVYWRAKDSPRCMAIDRYTRVADNLAAIAATLAAMRAIARHGGAEILERSFKGFAALPERAGGRSWRDILEIHPEAQATPEKVKKQFQELARRHHPDAGGSRDKYEELVIARDAAMRELGGNANG